ncbi:MAG: hypothetical protein RIC89_08955 [Pseudomonadales bacterium]
MLLRVVLTLVFLSPISAIHADSCTLEQLAGSYQSAYGKMECKAAAGQLECCYGNIRACDKKLALKLASRGNQLTGQWIEGSGQSGAARFAVTQDCSVDNGFWGNGRRATSPWSVSRVGQVKSAPAPTRKNAPATAQSDDNSQAEKERALRIRRAQLESISPLARFNRRIERNDAVVLLDTQTRCQETGDPLVVIAESEASIPESGRVLSALQNAKNSLRMECRREWRRFDVPVYTPSGEKLSESYMYMFKSGVLLPYSILSADYLDFLSNDPGYPFARVAPPLINIASGLWEREFTRGGWAQSMGGDAHWQTIAFQFALADAQLCKNQVGKTVAYKHTITQQDEYSVDTTTVTYEFDADWEPIILQILENGNHIGRPMGTGAKRIIGTFGCESEEVARLRRNPITVVAKTLGMPLPPGAGHVQQ